MRPRMHVNPVARPLACIAALAAAASALAEPPARSKHAPASSGGTTLRGKTADVGRAALVSATAAAYLEGKQALVGLHAPSTKPAARDTSGRAMLSLTNVNRGETLDVTAAGEDGGFAASELDRVAHLLRASGGEEHPIDPRTLALVYRIQTHFDVPEIRVVSGYRVPRLGSRSNHGKGRAVESHRSRGRRRRGRPLRPRHGFRRSGCLPGKPVRTRRHPPAQLLLGRRQRTAHEKSRTRHPRRSGDEERRRGRGARPAAHRAFPGRDRRRRGASGAWRNDGATSPGDDDEDDD